MLDASSSDILRDLRICVHAELPPDWPSIVDLGSAKCHVFQTREFLESWLSTVGAHLKARTFFVEITDMSGDRVMLLPLSVITRLGEATLTFADAGLADYNGPVLYDNAIAWTHENARSLWDAIVALLPPVDTIVLDKLTDGVGGAFNPLLLIADRPNDEGAHGSDLTVPWETIEATQAQLKTIRRRWRSLEKIGDVRFVVADSEQERDRIFQRLIAQKRRRFDDTQVRGYEYFPERLAYFQQATKVFAAVDRLQVCALMVGDEIVATSWSQVLGTHVYEIMIGFEAGEWTKYSCGRILNIMHLRWLKDHGFTYLDHGIGDESWKLDYCGTHLSLRKLVEIRSARGHAMAVLRDVKQGIRTNRAWEALRPVKFAIEKRLAPRS
jgi:CelD/BcsL family acetyltransferase involved in cellulose biosynthesis